MDLSTAIKSRKSTKKFSSKPVDWKKAIQAIDLARYIPLAGNMSTIKFIYVENPENLKKIADATQQDFVSEAGAAIVVVSDREKVTKMYDSRNKGFAQQQAGAAIQNLLLALTEKKIDHCWVGFFDDNLMNEATKVSGSNVVEAVIFLGVASKATKQKEAEKTALENMVFFEKFGNKKMEPESKVRHEWM